MTTPTPDPNEPMHEALRRDAARVPKPDFDPALHYATMRCLRGLAKTQTHRFCLTPALAATATMLALAVSLALWQMRSLPENHLASFQPSPLPVSPSPIVPADAGPRTSVLAYQTVASEGDDALFALLDRDARELLPTSSPVFNPPLH